MFDEGLFLCEKFLASIPRRLVGDLPKRIITYWTFERVFCRGVFMIFWNFMFSWKFYAWRNILKVLWYWPWLADVLFDSEPYLCGIRWVKNMANCLYNRWQSLGFCVQNVMFYSSLIKLAVLDLVGKISKCSFYFYKIYIVSFLFWNTKQAKHPNFIFKN